MSAALARRTLLAAGAGWLLGGAGAVRAGLDWPALALLDGRTIAPADWHDTAAVVVFWATWCGFCQRHNARLEALHRAVAGRPLRVIGVALDRDAAAVRRHVAAQGWTFPVTLQAEALRSLAGGRRITPLTVAVSRSGLVQPPIPGEMAADDLRALAALAAPARARCPPFHPGMPTC